MNHHAFILARMVASHGMPILVPAALALVLSCRSPVGESEDTKTTRDTFPTPPITTTQVAIRVWNDTPFRVRDLRLYFYANLGASGIQSHFFGQLDSNGTTGYAVIDLSRNADGTVLPYDTYQVIDIFRSYYDYPSSRPINFQTGYYTYVLRYHDSTFTLIASHFVQDSAGQPPIGINVRAQNQSQEYYDSVWVSFPDTTVAYGPLEPGACSFYAKVPSSYEYQTVRVWMGRKIAEYLLEDPMGMRMLQAGSYTYGLELYQMTKYRDIGFLKQDVLR